MGNWLTDKLSGALHRKKIPIEQVLPQLLDPGDPRTAIRPLGDDWLCPITRRRMVVPDWDGSSLTVLQQPEIFQHLATLPVIQEKGLETPLLTWEELVTRAVEIRLCESPYYKNTSDKGYWIC